MSLVRNSLAYHLNRPFLQHRDMSEVPVVRVMEALNKFMAEDTFPKAVPEHEALNFYLLNHAFSLLRMTYRKQELLGDHAEVADMYFNLTAKSASRAFYYLLLICVRESRHVKWTEGCVGSSQFVGQTFSQVYRQQFGNAAADLNQDILPKSSMDSAQYFRTNPPACTLGNLTRGLVFNFYNGRYSHSFGGPAWGKVADCLNAFVHGTYNAEAMMDTIWTLAHNNGPIFNKGMLYGGYSPDLITILDIQRSGQIPEFLHDFKNGVCYSLSKVSPEILHTWEILAAHFPEEFRGHLDWYKVEALGGVGHYSYQQADQDKKWGPGSKWAAILQQKKQEATKAKEEKYTPIVLPEIPAQYYQLNMVEKIKKLTREEIKKKLAQAA